MVDPRNEDHTLTAQGKSFVKPGNLEFDLIFQKSAL